MKRVFLAVSLVLALACCVGPAPAAAQEFFKGKTIRLIVGNSTGGSMDDWGRFVAQYLGRHIPGSPEIIVQNMHPHAPGAERKQQLGIFDGEYQHGISFSID